MNGKPADQKSVEHTTKNIRLVGQFLHDLLDDPTKIESIPDGATVVLLTEDDPELSQANLKAGSRAAELGKTVVVRHVG